MKHHKVDKYGQIPLVANDDKPTTWSVRTPFILMIIPVFVIVLVYLALR